MTFNFNTDKPIILLSLFSRGTPGKNLPSPKNYPYTYCLELVKFLKRDGFYTVQVGVESERGINADARLNNLCAKDLVALINKCSTFICCDNFLHHMAAFYKKRGIVIWGQSDPQVFGYQENVNLLKSRKFLRLPEEQFVYWSLANNKPEAFLAPHLILPHVKEILQSKA